MGIISGKEKEVERSSASKEIIIISLAISPGCRQSIRLGLDRGTRGEDPWDKALG
jgi:hypothetical protein